MKNFPGFDRIYLIRDPFSKRVLRGQFEAMADCLALTRGEANVSEKIRVSWAMGGANPSDFIWTTSAHPLIVHRRIVDLFREHSITGWSTYPVIVIDKAGHSHLDYEGLKIIGRCGPVDLSRSVIVPSEYPAGWFPHFLGHYFAEDSWDGSDIFMERVDSIGKVTARCFATEKVHRIYQKVGIENIRFECLTDRSVMTSIYEIGGSHLLPSDFSQRVDAAYARAGIPRPKSHD
jgi:hypothetical protein